MDVINEVEGKLENLTTGKKSCMRRLELEQRKFVLVLSQTPSQAGEAFEYFAGLRQNGSCDDRWRRQMTDDK